MSIFDSFRKKKKIPSPWEDYYKKGELNFNIPDISIYEQLKESSIKYSENIAYKYFDKKVKYKTLIEEIDQTAVALKSLGIRKGDIITICLPNIPEVLNLFYGLNKIGAIANMLHPLSAEEEIKESLNSTNSRYFFCIDMCYTKVNNIIHETTVRKTIFISATNSLNIVGKIAGFLTSINAYKKPIYSNNFINYKTFMKNIKKDINIISKYGSDTAAIILHSGGTTGKPKNVVIQNRAFVLGVIQEKIVLPNLHPGDKCLTIMPNFHGFGISVSIHSPLVLGYSIILIPQFNAKKFDTLLKKTKPSLILGVPTLYEALIKCKNETKLNLSCLKYAISGGDHLSSKLENQINLYLRKHNSHIRITQGYGMSESLAAVCLAHDEIYKPGSVGIPFPTNHIKIIDCATRKTVPHNTVGEICIHSKALMMGYLNDEVETNEVLQVHNDGHVWLHSGDLGYMDEDGFLFYKGRKKRMIITSGYNVYPSYIEEIIEKHPAVLQCTVVGVSHEYKQEVPKAFIVLKEGYRPIFEKTEIKKYCKKYLAYYMVPTEIVYRKNLPKTQLGKVDFQKLEEDFGDDYDE